MHRLLRFAPVSWFAATLLSGKAPSNFYIIVGQKIELHCKQHVGCPRYEASGDSVGEKNLPTTGVGLVQRQSILLFCLKFRIEENQSKGLRLQKSVF